jgi:A/G-specific adenine glycosylase
MTDFDLLIMDWYRQNKRDLPWRLTNDPYKIWLSEIIMQQTRVEQGLSYYLKFIDTYPTVFDLAHASEQEVLNLWQGLGYYSRARNLHFTSKTIAFEKSGKFPNTYKELLFLKGIGTYSAAAIASFSFKEPVGVVDGNVYRVLSRVFDIETPIDSSEGKKLFFDLAQNLINKDIPDIYNQAIMEFGALQCTPSNPNCGVCPLSTICLSSGAGTIASRPVKSKKIKITDRYFHFMLFNFDGNTYLEKRINNDIWLNLYQFPLIESRDNAEITNWEKYTLNNPSKVSSEIKHILSHQRIHAKFYHFSEKPITIDSNWKKIKLSEIQDFPLPRLIDRYLENE